MPIERFTTGSPELDGLLEELRAGDNVVFYVDGDENYYPFVLNALCQIPEGPGNVVYLRFSGQLDPFLDRLGSEAIVVDLEGLTDPNEIARYVRGRASEIGPRVFYVADPLDDLADATGGKMAQVFLQVCPYLYQLDTVAYWSMTQGRYDSHDLAAIKDCTQVFVQVDSMQADLGSSGHHELVITPVKVWGRYSADMFRPHRVWVDPTLIESNGAIPSLCPLPMSVVRQDLYVEALGEKNHELVELRDALERSNRALQQRNADLLEANDALEERNRLYHELQENLDDMRALVQARSQISASLVAQQVRQAAAEAAMGLFGAEAVRVTGKPGRSRRDVIVGDADLITEPAVSAAIERARVRASLGEPMVEFEPGELEIAVALLLSRGAHLGQLDVVRRGGEQLDDDAIVMLGRLAADVGMALDNAYLFDETVAQGRQLRSYLDNVIMTEEQDSRRFALDLHDGLVQLIVASFQHMQTAHALRRRDQQAEERELSQGMRILRQAISEARRLISQLRPAGLDDFGLVHALRIHLTQIQQQHDWHASLEIGEDWPERLPSTLEAALFRIVQEATSNAGKHAETARLVIQLQAEESTLGVKIRDWGRGFEPTEVLSRPDRGDHIGLIGIRERARLLGGRCEITSAPGEGTMIAVSLPRELVQEYAE